MSDNRDIKQLAWLKECGADLRARTQAEQLYTAAALTLFGGVCWGVASQHRIRTIAAALFVITLVTYAVCRKIFEDHKVYLKISASRAKTAKSLESEGEPYIFPAEIKPTENENNEIKEPANVVDRPFSLPDLLQEVVSFKEPDKSPGYLFSLRVLPVVKVPALEVSATRLLPPTAVRRLAAGFGDARQRAKAALGSYVVAR